MAEKVDLTNCDREPIHIPGAIQPHGAMLVLDRGLNQIRYMSENAASLIGNAALCAGCDLAQALGEQAAHDVRNAAAKAGGQQIAGIMLGLHLPGSATAFDITIHRHKELAFVELEPVIDGGTNAESALDITQALIRKIGLESDVVSIARSGARLIRAMLGYDRVMVYQFLHNGAGRVIGEAKRSDLNSFMGQHFPASDIPFQARRLYLLNTIRMIGNSAYAPVPLQPALVDDEPPVDMSFTQLRSVSPIHCEYLQNMGVQASMSISIVVDGDLWGLISCHHDSPKLVPLPLRIGAELFGQYYSLQISAAERRAQKLADSLARERLDAIVGVLSAEKSLASSLRDCLPEFASLVDCDGGVLWIAGEWTAFGAAPPTKDVQRLAKYVTETAKTSIWHTQDLRSVLGGEPYGTDVAGMLAIPLSSTPRDYLLLFRSEEAHNIEWAGEPLKKRIATPQGERLTPRGSFTTWREEVRGRSKPWTDHELAVAEAIRTYLRDILLRHNEITADERARGEKRRQLLNDELNHRVKNIIALVKSIALQTGAHATSVAEYSASLEGRLRALAFAHDQSLGGGDSNDLSTLIEAEASLHRYGSSPDRVSVAGPSISLSNRTFGVLALVIHEMMTNAAKYGALSAPAGRVAIAWRLDPDRNCEILWQESGGPALDTPEREGFGSKLIRSTIAYDLGGAVDIDYAPDGLRARLLIPAMHISESPLTNAAPGHAEPVAPSLAGLSALVVEDQALIALDTEETLRRLGVADVYLSPNAAEAIRAITDFTLDIAVLDFNLGPETSEAVADHLLQQAIPFVFSTGYGDTMMIPERFRHVPIVRKPVNGPILAAQLGVARTNLGA